MACRMGLTPGQHPPVSLWLRQKLSFETGSRLVKPSQKLRRTLGTIKTTKAQPNLTTTIRYIREQTMGSLCQFMLWLWKDSNLQSRCTPKSCGRPKKTLKNQCFAIRKPAHFSKRPFNRPRYLGLNGDIFFFCMSTYLFCSFGFCCIA